jgi:hypothetical protein
MAAFTNRTARLEEAIARGDIKRGILLTRPQVLDDRRREWAAERGIEVVDPSDLGRALDISIAGPTA